MKQALLSLLFLLLLGVLRVSSQDLNDNPFESVVGGSKEEEWIPTHPDGDTPFERMQSLVYTDALPAFDRAELYLLQIPDKK